ncbi:MAG TPA: STAS domain-containing protein [Candidatus Acidoferrum sp.]|jgi:anti-sigma B factor antagonist
MVPNPALRFSVEKSSDESTNRVTTIKCHGKLITDTAGEMREQIKPLISLGGRIVVDLTDLEYMDSSGLGTLVSLKASALHQGYCILEFVNMTPRVLDLLRVTNLTQIFSSQTGPSKSA